MSVMMNQPPTLSNSQESLRQARLWIDGVGCWLLWLPDTLTIGGPQSISSHQPGADLALFADLSRLQATIVRRGEHYIAQAAADVTVNDRPLTGEGWLKPGDELRLRSDVRLRFEIPSALSATARLTCPSGHRPADRIDGVILLEQACQLGAGLDHHVVCPHADESAVLFRKRDRLWCRVARDWSLDGRTISGAAELHHGALVTTDTLTFRVELT